MPICSRARPRATQRSATWTAVRWARAPLAPQRSDPQCGFCPRAGPVRNACLCTCAGARSARPDQMPASPPQGASGQAIRGAVGQGCRGGEPTVFHSSFAPSTASPVRAATAAIPYPGTASAPRTSPPRSCCASQPGDMPPSLPERQRTAGRGAEQRRDPAPPSRRRCGMPRPAQAAQARRGTARAQAASKMSVHIQPRLGPGRPRASGGLHERGICQAWMRAGVATLSCRRAARGRVPYASRNCLRAAARELRVGAQGRQGRLPGAAAPQGSDTCHIKDTGFS